MPPLNFNIQDILIAEYRIAAITAYNRLEAVPRTADFSRSLKAEIRDPLWMLTRQWQFGEFKGDDAGTAIGTKILGEHTTMDQVVFPDNKRFAYADAIPLETSIERENLKPNLFLAVQMGRHVLKLVRSNPNFTTRWNVWLNTYSLNYLPDPNDHEGKQLLNAVNGKMIDGFKLYKDIKDGLISTEDATNFAAEFSSFKNWYVRNYMQPDEGVQIPWQPSQLEYKFAVTSTDTSSQQKKLAADHYDEGHLDWYSFDLFTQDNTIDHPVPAVNNTQAIVSSFIPSAISFNGMPDPRFWALEDNQTDFGKIDTSPTGLLHLLFAEFGLICSNDWLMVPYLLSVNTLCDIKGMIVTDVFGQHSLVRPAGKGAESQWQRWTMFHHTGNNNVADHANGFYLVPAIPKSLVGEPVEQVNFLRDEMANLVWAVEKVVTSHSGKGVSGDEMAFKEVAPAPPLNFESPPEIRYLLGTTVPDNWIPFIPVHREGSNTEIRLQRAAMPGAKGALGTLLKEVNAPYYVDEEIIPRSGIQINICMQRTRWYNGKTYLWLGRKKETGKGEGWSNLKFDQLEYD
jgi:hypothetical protein